MTDTVVTAARAATIREVAELMRDRNVGSVVISDDDGHPQALITDRDVALAVADGTDHDEEAYEHATRPLVTGEPEMDVEEAAATMVQHRVRRLPLLERGRLCGIVTLDDLAVRTGDLKMAQQMTADVARAALPEFYFHQRGE